MWLQALILHCQTMGYKLVENEVKPSRFYETRGEVRDHVKKRKREGILPRQSKKQWRNEPFEMLVTAGKDGGVRMSLHGDVS